MIEFSVIICSYNRSDYLTQVLNSLKNQTLDKTRFEIILVNNNSTDETENVCLNFQNNNSELNISYYVEKNKGLSYARNSGIRISQGQWIIFLDDDAEPISDYLNNISTFLTENPRCVAAGGRIYPNYETKEPLWMTKYLLPLVSAIDLGDKVKKFSSNKYPIGANMIFRGDIFDKIGYFDVNLGRKENQLLGGEEKAIFMKLRNVSNEIYYIPNAIVYHFIPEKRIKIDFIESLAKKIGETNMIIYKDKGVSKLVLLELIKWNISFLLFLFYFLKFKPQKGVMLLKFRYWVLKGIRN